jgi:hypothetical protein
VLSVSHDLAQHIATSQGHRPVFIKDFDFSELHAYLKRRNLPWADIPPDVRDLICRPLLARLYGDLAASHPTFIPHTEYDLVAAAWNTLSDPTHAAALRKLAGTVYEANAAYPWPIEYAIEQAGSAETIRHLLRQGWLKEAEIGRVAIWHQRFLSWAYATFLFIRLTSNALTLAHLADTLRACYAERSRDQPELGYVPMDVLWLLLTPRSSYADLWRLLAALEIHSGEGHTDVTLYTHLIASLGVRAVPLLVDRVANSGEQEYNAIPRRAADALLLIGRHHPDLVANTAASCLDNSNTALQELGLRLVRKFPNSASPDRVWELYRSHIIKEKKDTRDYSQHQLAASAFRAVAAQNLAWLKQKLLQGDEPDSCLASLVYTLSNLENNDLARSIWISAKPHLIKSLSEYRTKRLPASVVQIEEFCSRSAGRC